MERRGTQPLYIHGHCQLANLHKCATNPQFWQNMGNPYLTQNPTPHALAHGFWCQSSKQYPMKLAGGVLRFLQLRARDS